MMNDETLIEFHLEALVNGKSFVMHGEGTGSSDEGTCTLHLEADPGYPEGFDPVSCPNICSNPTSWYFARRSAAGSSLPEMIGDAYQVNPARRGVIHAPDGKELLNLLVTGSVRRDGHRVISHHKMSGESHLPPLSHNVTPFDDFLLPSGEGRATALVRFELVALDGRRLNGMTTVPYRFSDKRSLPAPLARRVEEIRVDWDGRRSSSTFYRTSIRELGTTSGDASGLPVMKSRPSPAPEFPVPIGR